MAFTLLEPGWRYVEGMRSYLQTSLNLPEAYWRFLVAAPHNLLAPLEADWAPLRMAKTQVKDLGHHKADWAIKTLPGAFLRLFGA